MLESTISHSILDASSSGRRNTSPWDMAVAFNSADSSTGTRQLVEELDYLYKYDPARHGYVGRSHLVAKRTGLMLSLGGDAIVISLKP